MSLPLVILELVEAIKRLVSLSVTVDNRARKFRVAMLPFMTLEVARATDDCSTPWMVACKVLSIFCGTDASCVATGGETRQLSDMCAIRFDGITFRAIAIESVSGDRHGLQCIIIAEIVTPAERVVVAEAVDVEVVVVGVAVAEVVDVEVVGAGVVDVAVVVAEVGAADVVVVEVVVAEDFVAC